ncbi:hypothetical protein [Idiomarina baltica]|nr:hypothetical protein [Idiomarina baltica]
MSRWLLSRKMRDLRRVGYGVACAFGARAVSVVAQDARPTVVGADVAMNDVAQDARRTAVGCSMSRWLLSRRMRDVRWGDV